jgi:transposase
MKRFIAGAERGQSTLLPECLDEWVDEDKPARAIDAFVDALDLSELGFMGVKPAATGRPGYHPAPLLKLYIYGYVNRVQSSRRLEREAGRRCLAAIGRSGRKRVTWLRQSAHNRGAEKRVNPRNPLA